MTTFIRKLVSTTLIAAIMAQPVFASPEYRIPLRTLHPTIANPGTGPSNPGGNGSGVVDVGANPKPSKLQFAPASISFNAGSGEATVPVTKSTVLTNVGLGPAELTGFESNSDFVVTDDCPTTLAAGASCTVTASPTATAPAGATYTLTVVSATAAAPAMLPLTVSPTTPSTPLPQLLLQPEVVIMGTKLQPGESAAGGSVLSNVGKADAQLTGIKSGGNGYTVTSDCPATLSVGQSCRISAVFSSDVPGNYIQTLALKGTPDEEPTPLTFTARVVGDAAHLPALSFDTDFLMFDALDPGMTATKKAVLSNKGTVPAKLGQLISSPDFKITSDCPESLGVAASCNVTVVFNALNAGTAPSYMLTVNAQDDVFTQLSMAGKVTGTKGTSASDFIKLSTSLVSFGDVLVGESATRTVTVENSATEAIAVQSIKFGEGAASFVQTNDCGESLASAGTCTITLSFSPKVPSTPSGTLTLTYADKSQSAVGVSGRGIAAALSSGSTSIALGSIARPGSSKAKTVGIGNAGNIPLTGLAIANTDPRLQFNYGNCTDTVPAKNGCTFSFIFTPEADGPFSTTFQVVTDNGGSVTYTVTGLGVRVSMSPSSITFPSTQVGTSPAVETMTFSNDGDAEVPLDGVSVVSGVERFGQSNNCGVLLKVGATCSVAVKYSPQYVGSHTGVLGVSSNGVLVSQSALSGTAFDHRLSYSTKNVNFGSKPLNQPAPAMSVIVTNPAPDTTTISSIKVVSGETDYQATDNCGTELASGASCTVTIQFTPIAQKTRSGSISVVNSRGTDTLALNGEGAKPAQEKPGITLGGQTQTPTTPGDGFDHYAITFLDTEVNSSSAVRNIVFTNQGDGPLAVQGISVVDGSDDFKMSNNCGEILAPQKSCTISLVFTPTTLGERKGGVALTSDNGNFYFDLKGKGTGATAAWSTTGVDFGTTSAGSTITRSMVLRNTGTVAAKNIAVSLAGSEVSFTSNSCGTPGAPITLNAGSQCSVSVKYAPTVAGTLANAAVTATGQLANGTQVVPLKGSALESSLVIIPSASGTDYGNALVGAKTSRLFTIKNVSSATEILGDMPWVEGEGYSITASNCSKGYSLPKGYACTVTISSTSATPGEFSGVLYANTRSGASAQVDLTAKFHLTEVEVSSMGSASSPPVTDFGVATAGVGKVSRYYYIRDVNKEAPVVVNSVSLTGDSSFAVSAVEIVGNGYSDTSSGMYKCTGTSTTGLSTKCNSGYSDRSIRVTVTYSPTEAVPGSANLHIEHNGTSGSADLALTGTGAFDSAAAWSTSNAWTATPTAADLSFGTLSKTSSAVTKYVYLRNTGKYGRQSVGVMVSGDTANFTVRQITVMTDTAGSSVYQCLSGSGKADTSTYLSTTPCLTSDIAGMDTVSKGFYNIRVSIQFIPKAVGSYSATITPYTDNGTALPEAITVTGAGK